MGGTCCVNIQNGAVVSCTLGAVPDSYGNVCLISVLGTLYRFKNLNVSCNTFLMLTLLLTDLPLYVFRRQRELDRQNLKQFVDERQRVCQAS